MAPLDHAFPPFLPQACEPEPWRKDSDEADRLGTQHQFLSGTWCRSSYWIRFLQRKRRQRFELASC